MTNIVLTKTENDHQEIIVSKICKALERPDIAAILPQRIADLRKEFDAKGADIRKVNRGAKEFRRRFHAFKTRDGNFVDLLKRTIPGWEMDTPDVDDDGRTIRQKIGPFEVIDRQLAWLETVPGRDVRFDEAAFNDAFVAHMLVMEFSPATAPDDIKGLLHAITSYVQELRTGIAPKSENLRRAVDAVLKSLKPYSIP
jgi:hypothetical protein